MKKRDIIVTGLIVGSLLIGSTAVFASTSDGVASFLERFTNITEQKVEDGEITQTQADDIKSWIESAPESIENVFRGDMKGRGGMMGKDGGVVKQYAELKGVDVDDVMTTLKDGELSIFELAEQEGLFDELKAAMIEDCEEMLSTVVEEGKLTQEEADAKLAEMTEEFSNLTESSTMPEGKAMKPMNGVRPEGGFDGERPDGQFGGKRPTQSQRQTDTTTEES